MPGSQAGELSPSKLLSTLRLSLHPVTFVFLTFPPTALPPPATLFQQMSFAEAEGLTIISSLKSVQEHHLDHTFPSRMITCDVHSSLEAVGFMAALATRLTQKGIGANPVSGYYHDHLFVAAGREDEAMAALEELAKEASVESQKTQKQNTSVICDDES
ncbi:MAG: hypothetical protein Q9186_007006 [Xanthomendoza sp. 1 TL-2023]